VGRFSYAGIDDNQRRTQSFEGLASSDGLRCARNEAV
jgi:hypothetical protein